MRVIEISGQHGGQHNDADAGPSGPTMIGPGADADEHRFASRLRDTLAARHAAQAAHAEDERQVDAQTMRSLRKGGSKTALSFLPSLLDDGWTMIRGYQNSAGGIGQVLVSAHGVIAMTSLHLDATVHCHGDKWTAEKFNHSNGLRVSESHLLDGTGRSPSTQLNQAADELEHFLRSSGAEVKLQRVVLLNHPRSRVEESRRPSVQIFASPYDLARWLKELPKILDRGQRHKIEELVTGHAK